MTTCKFAIVLEPRWNQRFVHVASYFSSKCEVRSNVSDADDSKCEGNATKKKASKGGRCVAFIQRLNTFPVV